MKRDGTTSGEARGVAARLLDDRAALVAGGLVLLVVVLSAAAPLFTPWERDAIDLDAVLSAPSPSHAFGTDELGRDLLARLLFGGRFTLGAAFLAVAVASAAGIALGTLAGWAGGAADAAVSTVVDLFLSIPVFLVILFVAAAGSGSAFAVPLLIGLTSWMETARVVRATFLSLREEEDVVAARSLGARGSSIAFRHLLPQAMPPVIVAATVLFANAILVESALSFLGYGIQPPIPTWGNMLRNAQILIRRAPVAAFAPGFMIFAVCLAVNRFGAGLRRAFERSR